MATSHLEVLVEELSAEMFLSAILPKILGTEISFVIRTFQGKADLLGKLGSRLRGYARSLSPADRILVLVDRDNDDCKVLKARLEQEAAAARMATRTVAPDAWRVVNRIAMEELEAWFFGEWGAVRRAYPRAPEDGVRKAALRHCDQIAGGTWEALERTLQKAGYFPNGLPKVEVVQIIGEEFDPSACVSPRFKAFHSALLEAVR
jgi:hypothetical protein